MSSLLWTCAASEWRRFVQKTYAEEVKVQEILRVDVEQTHSEDTHRVSLTSCFHDLFALVWDLCVYWIESWARWSGCGWCIKNLFSETWTRETKATFSVKSVFFLWAECRRSNCIQSFCKDKIFEWGSIPTIMYMYLKYIKKFIAWSLSINYLHSIVVEREYLLANNMFFKSQLFWTERKQIVVKW